ncbi:MAG: hypothetical protein EOP06_02340, partial [Proteobacteria bacterium]
MEALKDLNFSPERLEIKDLDAARKTVNHALFTEAHLYWQRAEPIKGDKGPYVYRGDGVVGDENIYAAAVKAGGVVNLRRHKKPYQALELIDLTAAEGVCNCLYRRSLKREGENLSDHTRGWGDRHIMAFIDLR